MNNSLGYLHYKKYFFKSKLIICW